MKLQYLGDSRDAFKWDLLHWLCSQSKPPFQELLFIPLLTPDTEGSNEGNTPHKWFDCREFIRPFLASLKYSPRNLSRITSLGTIGAGQSFQVKVFHPNLYVPTGNRRQEYWDGHIPEQYSNSVAFFDPDIGFETRTRHGTKWIRHEELKRTLDRLPDNSVVIVYQHRPRRRTWSDVFADLSRRIDYACSVVAAFEGNLAFVALAKNTDTGRRVVVALREYSASHPVVKFQVLREGQDEIGYGY